MHLCPREIDKLALHAAGSLAQKRLARGLRLNFPEATALIASQILELIRDGFEGKNLGVAQLMDVGRRMLGRRHVLPHVAGMLVEVQVEGTFPDGTKLVTVHDPVCTDDGDIDLALYGSFLPIPSKDKFPAPELVGAGGGKAGGKKRKASGAGDAAAAAELASSAALALGPVGGVHTLDGDLVLNKGRDGVMCKVTNTGDRPIQVGSHYHFIETNGLLSFDRELSLGRRLNIPAGTAVRFEPGESKAVPLVAIAGNRIVRGGNNIVDGTADGPAALAKAMKNVVDGGFLHVKALGAPAPAPPLLITRAKYAAMYGPTVGDRVRLGDTNLFLTVEKDLSVYGEECKFGGGKTLREGMGQQCGVGADLTLDTVITNALIVDYTGIYKADVGIKGGMIVGIGKAGNPDVMEGVTPGMVVGVNTEAIGGEGHLLTAGGLDTHIHFICPQIATEAVASGLTTLLGGGTGPASGTCATTCTPAPAHIKMMLQTTDTLPLNFAFTGKGNTSKPEGLDDIIKAGAVGLKLHEDWGTTPAAIDNCLNVAELHDIAVTIHTDTLNESCCVEKSVAAFKGRTIHTYHSEGAGGGHAPDIIKVCGELAVLPSSTNPTRPYTRNTVDEHLDMLMVCHHLDKNIPEDVAFAESRIRAETIAAEDIMHDMGAISIMSSDSQAMGRIGETITRTWQTAAKMKEQRGQLEEDKAAGPGSDNFRIRRYIAKYTINPAVAHGISHVVGSIEVGKLADLVMWKPMFFGSKPEIIIKGGQIAWAQMGDPNASIPTPEPVIMRPMFAALRPGTTCVAFVSKAAADLGVGVEYGLSKRVMPVVKCRGLTKLDMRLNSTLPVITVDPETYVVTADGVALTCEPADSLPLTQTYMLF
mmetsp:Transcript_3700/g.8868  ORF Transcript_3700/g.8868 Transcript_3700/m.8868 type:complete len:872 (+) Transcript_3700:582-3197(+)